MNKKEVFMCLDETDIGPIFSTFDKAKDYLTENGMNEKLNNHDFVHGYYPVIMNYQSAKANWFPTQSVASQFLVRSYTKTVGLYDSSYRYLVS